MPCEWLDRFEKSASVTCVIDADSTIIYCNPAWNAFAFDNNGECATSSYVLGKSLFSYVPSALEPHYRKLLAASRVGRKGAGSDYECHSVDKFRKYHMEVLPIPGSDLLAMVHSLRVEQAMTFERRQHSDYHHGPGNVVTMCAHCRRAKNNQHSLWEWVPDFIKAPPMRISHGICPDCTMYLYA
jgi:hypothetical protein